MVDNPSWPDDCSIIVTALGRLSKKTRTSGFEAVDLVRGLVDEVEESMRPLQRQSRRLSGRSSRFPSLRSRPIILAMMSKVYVDGSRLPVRVRQSYYISLQRL